MQGRGGAAGATASTGGSGLPRDSPDPSPTEPVSEDESAPEPGKQTQTKPRRVARRAARPTTRPPKGFAFIAAGPGGKPAEDTRKSIRSHVMRGKNIKKSPDQDGTEKKKKGTSKTASGSTAVYGAESKDEYYPVPGYRDVWVRAGPFKEPIIHPRKIQVPRRLDLSLLSHPEAPDVPTQQLLRRFFVTMELNMFPIERCFLPYGTYRGWQDWIIDDPVCLFNSLFIVSSLYDQWSTSTTPNLVLPKPDLLSQLSARSNRYLQNTIKILQEHINDPKLRADDRTMCVVMSLAQIYESIGDWQATMAHFNGLRQMVKMRGGVEGLKGTMLREICRVDLGGHLRFGRPPEFHQGEIDWNYRYDEVIAKESYVAPEPITNPGIRALVEDLDPPIRNAFLDLRAFTSVADRLSFSQKKLRSDLFPEIISSVQYRCLRLNYSTKTNLIDEAFRIGILAFLAAALLKMHGSQTRFEFIGEKVQHVLELLPEHDPVMAQLKLWLAYTGASAAIDPTAEWLVNMVRRLSGGSDCNEVRAKLSEVMWIRVIQDRAGRQLFEGSLDESQDSTLSSLVNGFWDQVDKHHSKK